MRSRNFLAFPLATALGGLLLFGGAMCSNEPPEADDPLSEKIIRENHGYTASIFRRYRAVGDDAGGGDFV